MPWDYDGYVVNIIILRNILVSSDVHELATGCVDVHTLCQ